ncbi:unnamed protein product [Chondrus crispus]|uniref:Uncharacterized protein n=1 Tax=Chondrus crispus TaxID=2769 RepID=R7Q6J0_CHOCR|nr:unnamed protein product [Chondrus crispus]CDF34162.1 unnamed protein product [Chondrus crispus]|eukprot:XP_005713981.1 unnamed protein product [Chondrus crispus]
MLHCTSTFFRQLLILNMNAQISIHLSEKLQYRTLYDIGRSCRGPRRLIHMNRNVLNNWGQKE